MITETVNEERWWVVECSRSAWSGWAPMNQRLTTLEMARAEIKRLRRELRCYRYRVVEVVERRRVVGSRDVELKTICTRCKEPLTLHWPAIVEFGGERMPAKDAIAASLRNDSVWICCDKCLAEMPDVKLDDLRIA